jgi:hypothetical protein
VSGTRSRKIFDPYVVVSPAVSKRSLTPRLIPSPTVSGTARNAFRSSVVLRDGVVDHGDEDRPAEEDEGECEEREAQADVLAGGLGIHQKRRGSMAMATKSRAR